MADNLEFPSEASSENQSTPEQLERMIPVKLPPDIALAIAQRINQSGSTQTQDLFEGIRSALGLSQQQAAETQAAETQATEILAAAIAPRQSEPPPKKFIEEFRLLKARLAELESLIPKLEALEGKSMAF